MKRIMCLIFLLLTSCAPVPVNPPPASASPSPVYASPPASVPMSSAFTYDHECPHICWLGINPGVTTVEEAKTIIYSSNQFVEGTDDESDNPVDNKIGFGVDWHTEQMGAGSTRVGMVFENGVVQDINFSFYTYVMIQEFIEVLGKPNEINIRIMQAPDARYINYILYYTSMNALIIVSAHNETGPDVEDSVDVLYLNISPDDPIASDIINFWLGQDLRQPWLGFGHLEEYLKNRPSPEE
jgi:hypothetical protein